MVQMAFSPLPQWFEGSEYTLSLIHICAEQYLRFRDAFAEQLRHFPRQAGGSIMAKNLFGACGQIVNGAIAYLAPDGGGPVTPHTHSFFSSSSSFFGGTGGVGGVGGVGWGL